ncbi:MAG: type II secretion system protein [Patescibacteria group bacterium]
MRGGFTLIEITIVLALFIVAGYFTLPLGIESYRNYILGAEIRNILSVLRRAESLAMSNTYQSRFGVSFQSEQYVLFKGDNYAGRDQLFDEIYAMSPGVIVSSTPEVVFSTISGRPSVATSTITLLNPLHSQTLNINSEGTILW